MMPPRQPLTVVRLADHFGQYVLTLTCACGHSRTAQPKTLAALAGWDALLADGEAPALLSMRQAAMQCLDQADYAVTAQSAHNNSACASTVFTASSCKSGG
jgi:hypothetical protein